MASEQFPDDLWKDFDGTAKARRIIELAPDLTPELMAIPTDDPNERVLWPPTDEVWVGAAEHVEAAPNEFQRRTLGAIALVTAYERGNADAADALDLTQTQEMLVNLGCHEIGEEYAAEALLARQAAYELCGESELFARAAEIYEQYIATFPTRETQRNDMSRVDNEVLPLDDMLSKLIRMGATAISRNPLRRQNLLRIMSATIAQIDHYKELNGIAGEITDEKLFEQLGAESTVDSKYDIAPDPLPPLRKYLSEEFVQLPMDTIVNADGQVVSPREKTPQDTDYEKPVEPESTELFTLMNKVIEARTKADAQIATRNFRMVEIHAEIMLNNMDYKETPKNVLLVHRARLAAFVIAGIPHKYLQPVRATFDSVRIGKSGWPDMVERMKESVESSSALTSKIDACLPFLIDSPDEQELVAEIIVVTLQQIAHWKQELARVEAARG